MIGKRFLPATRASRRILTWVARPTLDHRERIRTMNLISRTPGRMFLIAIGVGLALVAVAIGVSNGGSASAGADGAEQTVPPNLSILDGNAGAPTADRLAELDKAFGQAQKKPAEGAALSVHLSNGTEVAIFRAIDGDYGLFVTSPAPERSSAGGCGTLGDIAKGRFSVAGKAPGTGGGYLVAGIAPDGVSAVDLDAGPEGAASARATTENTSLSVIDNVFGGIVPVRPEAISWWAADGSRVTRDFGR